ncbi:MAG: hypothetical protein JNM24_20195 [Bdellovibrionaceae bacterium]|nr:hypothetical protein [Pseudobdellovibrionaceae bacterium]
MRKRVPFKAQFLIGNHNSEVVSDGPKSVEDAIQVCKKWLDLVVEVNFVFVANDPRDSRRKMISLTRNGQAAKQVGTQPLE